MPDKKLTDNECVKACKNCLHLEVCLKNLTNAFPDTSQEEINLVLVREGCCKNFIDKDLINRLQAENEEYQKIKTTIDEFWEILLTLSLYKRKEKPTLEEFAEAIQEIKSEAYKEFAEKLKEKLFEPVETWLESDIVRECDIDNTLKELVGE